MEYPSTVTLTGYRQRLSIGYSLAESSAADTPTSSDGSRLSTAFSSSDADLSSATQSPCHYPGSISHKRQSSLTSLFHKLNIRRSSTASSLEQSPRKQQDGESSDEDGILKRIKKKSKSTTNLKRKKKTSLPRQTAHVDLMDTQQDDVSSLGARSKSLDVLTEAVCQNCRLHSIATDSGIGSMSLTAPTDSPLWLGWHSTGEHTASGESSKFLAQAQLAQSHPDLLAAADEAGDESNSDAVQCKECGSMFRGRQQFNPTIRVEFEQDYMC